MNSHQSHETGFWRGLVDRHGIHYRDFRVSEYEDKVKWFHPLWTRREGQGIDVGCGCVSVLDGITNFVAVDALWNEYDQWSLPVANPHLQADAEDLPYEDGTFGWAMCVNMIDHTPDPVKAIHEIYRVLVPGGKLFFEVHFDDALSPAHYGLWDIKTVIDTVDQVFGAAIQLKVIRVDQDNQSQCWAVYEKR